MKVRDVMQVRVITILPDAPYEEAARLLRVYNVSGVPVVDESGHIIGILSEKDLFRALYPNYADFYKNPEAYLDLEAREKVVAHLRGKPVRDIMSSELTIVSPEDKVMKAGSIMLTKSVHRLPVVEEGKLVGIISRRDIFKNIIQHHLGEV
ncbi:MAG: histidine kinase [Candidatus Zambryskibacteria bacterium CG10_big_fil_rev_8_21_14_0_10_42_12]|uniref:Histidine kinase n=1 Tax=Candidatus Zambryskibacteria bacterium CG10_big_fil_rev_8_21_14_0_10_42_12 TaxID=1975115 RepID=A0A2H0QWE7_9BACT|nr:MAG: histidine kinase [Candidatus Zambryskibacteria bacterium CG10_big_fil_rev_8_21_14_0_10_42_12]